MSAETTKSGKNLKLVWDNMYHLWKKNFNYTILPIAAVKGVTTVDPIPREWVKFFINMVNII